MTRILFINAVKKPNKIVLMLMPPLGFGYIASYLRKYHSTDEMNIISRSYEHDIYDLINKYKPEVVGISSTTQNYSIACSIANRIKEIDDTILIIIGGPHITALPKNLNKAMDIGVLGEGEETFCDIIGAYQENKMSESTFSKIPGIVFWNEKQIIMTKRRNLIKPIDNIPFPARDLYDKEDWATILTSRGCPYKCIFCASSTFWSSVRLHSPEYVVGEIKELVHKYKVNHIGIADDLFIADKNRVKEISRLIQDEGINNRVQFFCHCRSNLINEEVIESLKSMNITEIGIGFESGSNNVLKRIEKGSTVQDNLKAIEIIKKYNINIKGYFVIGAPDESKEEMLETYEFIKNNPMDNFNLNVMIPFPGTDIWEYAKAKDLVNESMDWEKFDMDFQKNLNYLVIDDSVSKNDLTKIYNLITNEIEGQRKNRICLKTYGKKWGQFAFQISKIPGVYEIGRHCLNWYKNLNTYKYEGLDS